MLRKMQIGKAAMNQVIVSQPFSFRMKIGSPCTDAHRVFSMGLLYCEADCLDIGIKAVYFLVA